MKLLHKIAITAVALATLSLASPAQARGWWFPHIFRGRVVVVGNPYYYGYYRPGYYSGYAPAYYGYYPYYGGVYYGGGIAFGGHGYYRGGYGYRGGYSGGYRGSYSGGGHHR